MLKMEEGSARKVKESENIENTQEVKIIKRAQQMEDDNRR